MKTLSRNSTSLAWVAASFLFATAARSESQPVTPGAQPEVKNVLSYLQKLSQRKERRTLIGQCCSGNGRYDRMLSDYEAGVVRLKEKTGRAPALLEVHLFAMFTGAFIGHENEFVDFVAGKHDEGFMIYVALRPPNAETGGGEQFRRSGDKIPKDLATVYTPGTPQYRRFRGNLQLAGYVLAGLARRHVPVLFEPFNELNGRWNWFAHDRPEEFAELWRYVFRYLVKERRLKNLLWVWEWHKCGREVDWRRYPGDDYVDILGLSVYDSAPDGKYVDLMRSLAGKGKPVGFAEYGPHFRRNMKREETYFSWDNLVQLRAFKKHYPMASFFIRWGGRWAIGAQKNAKEFMADPWFVDHEAFRREFRGSSR